MSGVNQLRVGVLEIGNVLSSWKHFVAANCDAQSRQLTAQSCQNSRRHSRRGEQVQSSSSVQLRPPTAETASFLTGWPRPVLEMLSV
jgi:hypothetical protein